MRQHIALVTTSFPDVAFKPGQEAAGGFVYDFAEALTEHVQVSVVAPSKTTSYEQAGKLNIYRFAVPSLPLSLLKPANPLQWPHIISTLKGGQSALEQVVHKNAIDHIFALWALPSGYWARTICKKYNIPYSVWALGSDIWGLGRVPLIKNVLRSVLRDSSARFADGFVLKDDVIELSGMDCAFLPSSRKLPVQGSKRLATSPPYKLAFLGRWHRNKGIDILLESLSLLNKEDWHKIEAVHIFGGGPLEEEVHSKCNKLAEAGHPVKVGGYLNTTEAAELLSWADYLLIPSRIESIPVIFSDAMQANCPIITMPVGDLPRLIKEYQVGVTSTSVNAIDFANAMQKGLSNFPSQYVTELDKAKRVFDIRVSAKKFITIV